MSSSGGNGQAQFSVPTLDETAQVMSFQDMVRSFSQDNLWVAAKESRAQQWELALTRTLPKREKGRMLDILKSVSLLNPTQFFNPDKMSLATKKRMMLDSQVAASYQLIVNAVTGRGFEISGGAPETLKFIRNMYENLPMSRTFQQVLSAFWVGFSATEKVFKTDQNGLDFISKYKVLPPQTISFDIRDNGIIDFIWQSGHLIGIDKFIRWRPDAVNILTYDGGINDTFGNPFGVSGLKPAHRDWFSKDIVLQLQNRMLERVAGGMTVLNAGWANAEIIAKIAEQYKTSGLFVTTGEQTVQQFNPTSEGSAFMESIIYHDIQIAKAMLVPPILLDQASKFGSRSLAQIHLDMFKLGRVIPFQEMLTTWTEFDIKQVIDHNFGIQEPNDQGRSTYPQFKFKVWSQRELELLSNHFLKAAKGQWAGKEDIPHMRRETEFPDGDMNTIGEPLIPPRGSGNPSGSGSAGDATADGTDVASGGDMEDLEEKMVSMLAQFNDLNEKIEFLVNNAS